MKYCYAALFLFCIACQRMPNSEPLSESFNPKSGEKYILFLNYRFINTEDSPQATFINYIITEGGLKPQSDPPELLPPYIILQLLDKDDTILKEIPLTNPLVKDVEYVEDNGSFARKKITLEQAELSIRLQLPHETEQIILWYILESDEKIELDRKII